MRYSKEIIIISVLIFLNVILVLTNNYICSYYALGKGYEWEANASTTNGLPIMFAKCELQYTGHYENGFDKNIMLRGDISNHTVDYINCGDSGLSSYKELYPNVITILYYSFKEEKFYGATFNFDYAKLLATAEKMRKAVKLNESGLTESIVFNVKVYPMGKVTVSMKSYIETKIGEIIIANFQAKAEQHDWSVFGNEDYDDDKSRGISKSNSVAIQRALLMEQYNWQLEVLIPKDNKLETLNVDRYGTNGLKMDTIKNTLNPTFSNFGYMPQAISLKWQRSDTIKFLAGFRFDEQELITAFHNIDKPNGKQQITIQVVAKNDTTALQASIRSGVKSFKLKNLNKEKVYSDKVYH